MAQSTFERFCDKENINGTTRAAFRDWLKAKYPEGIPDNVNLRREWAEFYRESTSKVE